MDSLSPAALALAAQQLLATKLYLVAAFTILVWDHLLTFSQEVEQVWKKKIGLVSCLFLLNRYYTLVAMSSVLVAFFLPSWSREPEAFPTYLLCRCAHFVAFEPFGNAIPLLAITGSLLTLRLYALYQRNIWVLLYLSTLLLSQIAVGLWEFSVPGWGPTQLPPYDIDAFHGCLYAPAPSLGKAAGSYLVLEVLFDISVFGLTMLKTWRTFWNTQNSGLVKRISRDGAMYFIVIFSTNCVWLFMVLFAPLGVKYINANPAVMLIVTMINRLTLNLRVEGDHPTESGTYSAVALRWRVRNWNAATSLPVWNNKPGGGGPSTTTGTTDAATAVEGSAYEMSYLQQKEQGPSE